MIMHIGKGDHLMAVFEKSIWCFVLVWLQVTVKERLNDVLGNQNMK